MSNCCLRFWPRRDLEAEEEVEEEDIDMDFISFSSRDFCRVF